MSWLSNFLGLKKIKPPPVQGVEMSPADALDEEQYLKFLAKKSGFEKTIKTGRKKPKLAEKSYLGAVA